MWFGPALTELNGEAFGEAKVCGRQQESRFSVHEMLVHCSFYGGFKVFTTTRSPNSSPEVIKSPL